MVVYFGMYLRVFTEAVRAVVVCYYAIGIAPNQVAIVFHRRGIDFVERLVLRVFLVSTLQPNQPTNHKEVRDGGCENFNLF